jgi:hypothetical protein
MADQERINRWWEALSEEERSAARRADETGHLTDGLRQSLRDAGVMASNKGPAGARPLPLPPDVHEFLKMRH